MSTIYKCDRCGREMNKIHNRLKEVVIEGKLRIEGTKFFEPETIDLCEECYKDFKSFMFGPERDLDSKTTLRPWSEVGEPPKINGCELCESESKKDTDHTYSVGSYVVSKSNRSRVCKITDIVKNDQGDVCYKLVGLDSKRTENTVTKNYLDSFYAIFYDPLAANDDSDSYEGTKDTGCEQCEFDSTSIDEEPCASCLLRYFKPKEEDSKYSTDTNNLSKAKYKLASYIRSDENGDSGSIYKIVDIRLRIDGEIIYRVKDLSRNTYSTLTESTIDHWYTVIVKYSCEGCKLEGTDDVMCDTCIVGDPKGPRRQWWKPKEEGE